MLLLLSAYADFWKDLIQLGKRGEREPPGFPKPKHSPTFCDLRKWKVPNGFQERALATRTGHLVAKEMILKLLN